MKQQLDNIDESELGRTEAIIQSMTRQERLMPKLLNGSRRLRIARGSGTTVTEVNSLVNRFEQAAKMMKTVAKGGVPNIPGVGPLPGARYGKAKAQQKKGSRSGNPAKRARENAAFAADAAAKPAASGSGFGLGGGAAPTPNPEDLETMQKLLGNRGR
jgi:signal recognition particle subunit SRP54